MSYFCSSFYNHVAKDNVVYHGLAGHFFLQDISHVLKVRIIAKTEDRIREEMKREGCSEETACQEVAGFIVENYGVKDVVYTTPLAAKKSLCKPFL